MIKLPLYLKMNKLTIAKADHGPFKGSWCIVTLEHEEVLESFGTLREAERWLYDEELLREEALERALDEFSTEYQDRLRNR